MSSEGEESYEMIFGNNRILSTGTIIAVGEGDDRKELVSFTIGSDGMPAVNARVDDENGELIAGIMENRPIKSRDDHYIEITPGRIKIENKTTGEIPLDFEYLDKNKIKLNGIFYIKGERLEATDHGVTFRTNTISGNTSKNLKNFLSIFEDSFSIG